MQDLELTSPNLIELDEQQFIDININEGDYEPTQPTTNENKKKAGSLFNFRNYSKNLVKSKSVSCHESAASAAKEHRPLVLSNSNPIASNADANRAALLSPSTQIITQAADVLLMHLDQIDLNSNDEEDDDDDDDDIELANYDKLKSTAGKQKLLNNCLTSPSTNSLNESSDPTLGKCLKRTEHSTPLPSKSTSSLENLNDSKADDLNETLESTFSKTLSLYEEQVTVGNLTKEIPKKSIKK